MVQPGEFQRRRQARGRPYTLGEFAKRYGLAEDEAKDLYIRFGPSAIELDLLMAAKKKMPSIPDRLVD